MEGRILKANRIFSDNLEWQPTRAKGFWVKPLREDEETGERTVLMKVDAGAFVESHSHPNEFEQCFVVQGSFYDEHGTMNAGDYCYRLPNEPHTAGSENGALILLIFNRRSFQA